MKEVLRTCCVCKTKQDKHNMTRIVNNNNNYIIDDKKQSNGKATYVCKNKQCIDTLEKKKSLNRAFKTNVSEEIYKKIVEELKVANCNN